MGWSLQPVSTGTSTSEPVSIDDLMEHLRLPSDSTEDTFVAGKITAARKALESLTEKSCFLNQFDLVLDRDALPCDGPIVLPKGPLYSVESFTYYDSDDVAHTFTSSGYVLDTYRVPGRIVPASGSVWPSGVRPYVAAVIRFTAGYAPSSSPSAVPDPIVEAIKKLATELYENRPTRAIGEGVNELPEYAAMLSEFLDVEIG